MCFPWGILAILFFFLAALTWCRLTRPERVSDWPIFTFCFLVSQIIVAGFVLSAFHQLNSVFWWKIAALFLFFLSFGASLLRRAAPGRSCSRAFLSAKNWSKNLPPWERNVLLIVCSTVAVVGILNGAVVLLSAPHTWDNMAYRLARMAYYLQQGHIGYYDAGYIQQIAVQKNCGILMAFSFIASGRNENFTQIWQFFAYWISAVCVFGISRELGWKRSASLLASGIFSLLTICLMQATTSQSDMLLAAFAGTVVYALISYRNRPRAAFLFLAALGIALGWGVKASFSLFMPSLLLIIAYVFFRRGRFFGVRGLARFALFILPAWLVLSLPSAYWDNYRIFGHPMGPEEFRELNSYEGKPLSFILPAGSKHLLRNGFDFLSLDGMPPLPLIWDIQDGIRYPPWLLTSVLGIDLERDLVNPWFYFPPPYSHEDYSSWGIMGWSLVWPALILAAAGILKHRARGTLAFGALLFIVAHSFSGIYDFAGRSRYLLPATVMAVPAVGGWFYARSRVLKTWLVIFIVFGCLSAMTAVLFRYRSSVWFDQSVWLQGRLPAVQEEARPLPLRTESLFGMDRLSQVLRDVPVFDEPLRNFERLVPVTATVAVALNPNSPEYPLFGQGLTRKIIPINSAHRGLQPIPPQADYLLWADDFDMIFDRGGKDVHLGKDWWLRQLK